nr:immunoglobulin light chain junction region [Macaca mulatta]MOV77757.1 immunoglobulin light chain junction region [Macaca mulatta]MOV78323.1 immunoglobulin light chain junction region [Macaca mulatta]MOV78579.1 immunoglobulin light chain junction region [Macaca mulatta]MOV79609.1 immunoglobulin light chain junction region [Macaca mulatta]
CQQYDSDTRTF